MRFSSKEKGRQEESSQAQAHPDFENNHDLGKWLMLNLPDLSKAKKEFYSLRVMLHSNRLEFSWRDVKGIMWCNPLSFNFFTNDFKGKCNNILFHLGIIK